MGAKTDNLAISAIQAAVKEPNVYPDPIVIGILQNDLTKVVCIAQQYRLTLDQVDQAIRHVKSRVTIGDVKALLKKWGKK